MTAQIVPVLYLALAVEMRFFSWRDHHLGLPHRLWLLPVAVPLIFLVAEAASLAPLLANLDTHATRVFCLFGLGFTSGLVLIWPLMLWHLEGAEKARERHQEGVAEDLEMRATIAGVLVLGLALLPAVAVWVAPAVGRLL